MKGDSPINTSKRISISVLFVGTACGAVVMGACGTDRPDDIDVASTSSAITNGQPEVAEAQGMPWVKKWSNGAYDDDGSAVLLTNDWVLTAKHVASRADYPSWRSKFAMRNASGGGVQERDPLPDQMFDHPTRDVALMKLRTPFVIGGQSSGWTRAISLEPNVPTLVSNNPHARCFGYARTGTHLDSREFSLGEDVASPGHLTLDPLLFVAYWGGGAIDPGDSGGPCLTLLPGPSGKPEVLGVDHEGYGGGLDISRYESAPGFRDLFVAIMNAEYAVQGDIDADGKGDTLLLTCQGGSYHLELRWGAGGAPVDLTWLVPSSLLSCTNLPPTTPKPFAARGNFNSDKSSSSDPFDDFLLVIQGTPLYFDGTIAGLVAHPLDFGGTQYDSFTVADFDGDGYDDAEGLTADGYTDVYYGSPTGLTAAVEMSGVPTADGSDGKFLSLSGPGLITVVYPSTEMNIYPDNPSDLRVEVFDGDMGGMLDNAIPGILPDDGKKDVAC